MAIASAHNLRVIAIDCASAQRAPAGGAQPWAAGACGLFQPLPHQEPRRCGGRRVAVTCRDRALAQRIAELRRDGHAAPLPAPTRLGYNSRLDAPAGGPYSTSSCPTCRRWIAAQGASWGRSYRRVAWKANPGRCGLAGTSDPSGHSWNSSWLSASPLVPTASPMLRGALSTPSPEPAAEFLGYRQPAPAATAPSSRNWPAAGVRGRRSFYYPHPDPPQPAYCRSGLRARQPAGHRAA